MCKSVYPLPRYALGQNVCLSDQKNTVQPENIKDKQNNKLAISVQAKKKKKHVWEKHVRMYLSTAFGFEYLHLHG